jgi:DNA-binding MarR family transcriptional regulator
MRNGRTAAKGRDAKSRSQPKFLEGYLPYLLGHASYAMNKDFDRHVRMHGLKPLEWRVLATLYDEEGLTIGELARKVVAKQPTLTKTIKKMAELDLVRRAAGTDDLRKTLVYETKRGAELVRGLIDQARAHEARLLHGVSNADLTAFRRVLQALVQRAHSPLRFTDAHP